MKKSCILNYKKTDLSLLLIMLPHSGRNYGDIFKNISDLSIKELRQSEDSYIDLLLDKCSLKFNYLQANFPRIFVDVNRSPLEIDYNMWKNCFNISRFNRSLKVQSGIGVIPRVCYNGTFIYNKTLFFKEARQRLLNYYFPYHKKIKTFINEIKNKHNKVIALDCHSMSSKIVDNKIDIVLSNNSGKSSNLLIINKLKECFNKYGYNVRVNSPFKGGFITKHYGSPINKIQVIQIEINKKLYLIEENFNINTKKFDNLKNCFSDTINYINDNINLF